MGSHLLQPHGLTQRGASLRIFGNCYAMKGNNKEQKLAKSIVVCNNAYHSAPLDQTNKETIAKPLQKAQEYAWSKLLT